MSRRRNRGPPRGWRDPKPRPASAKGVLDEAALLEQALALHEQGHEAAAAGAEGALQLYYQVRFGFAALPQEVVGKGTNLRPLDMGIVPLRAES